MPKQTPLIAATTAQRTVTCRVVANIGKLRQLDTLTATVRDVAQCALHLYQSVVVTASFDYADPTTRTFIDNTIYDRLRHRFPMVYSKSVQKICRQVVSSTLADSVNKLKSTKIVAVVSIFDTQMADLKWKLGRKRRKCWLQLIGLRKREPATGAWLNTYTKIRLALVGDRPLNDIWNAVSPDEFQVVSKPRKLKTNNRHNRKQTAKLLADAEAGRCSLWSHRVHVVITERISVIAPLVVIATTTEPASLPDATALKLSVKQVRFISDINDRCFGLSATTTRQLRLPLTDRRILGIDLNWRSVDASNGAVDFSWSLAEYADRAIAHRKNDKKFRRFGRDFIEQLTTDIRRFCQVHGIKIVVLEDLKKLRLQSTRLTCSKGTAFRHMANAGFPVGQFRTRLFAKLKKIGAVGRVVDPAYTSQRCSRCGWSAAANRPTTEGFRCRSCELALHSGINAARNVRLKWLTGRLLSQRRPKQQHNSDTVVQCRWPSMFVSRRRLEKLQSKIPKTILL